MSQDLVIEGAVLSYPHLFQARQVNNQGEPRFGANLILPENFDWTALQQAIAEAKAVTWPQGAPPDDKLRLPFSQVTEGPYAGRWQVTTSAKADRPPAVVMQDPNVKAGPHQTGEFFPGCLVNAYVRSFAYANKPGNGVSLGLNAVQLNSNDPSLPRLDSQKAPTDVFQTIPGGPAATAGVAGQPVGQMPQQPQQPAQQQQPAGQPPMPAGSGVAPGAPETAPSQVTDPNAMPWNQ